MQTIAEKIEKINHGLLLLVTVTLSWAIPGGGYFLLGEKKRGLIVLIAITVTFVTGLYIGSIGVICPVSGGMGLLGRVNPWYIGQVLNSPLVFLIGNATASGAYQVYGKPQEIGQLYTTISGLLNLLCILNCVYIAHTRKGRADD